LAANDVVGVDAGTTAGEAVVLELV